MPFKEGFEAIDQIKKSGQQLGETIARLERLEDNLSLLREAHEKLDGQLGESRSTLQIMTEASRALAEQQAEYLKLARKLPDLVESTLAAAEADFSARVRKLVDTVERLPSIVEVVVEQKLSALISHQEGRLSERFRDELRDTRVTLRETLENSANRHEARLDELKKDIVAELPRGIFGRRGRN
ncbi:hypothetical protein ACFQX4_25705 [Roseomonas sp. GCM10028921]